MFAPLDFTLEFSTTAMVHSSYFVHADCSEALFQSTYTRNNKSSERKNIRCFPHCCGDGHRERSFCGSALTAVYVGSAECTMALGRFEPSQALSFHVGTDLTMSPMVGSFREWYTAKLELNNSQQFTFQPKSWHYGVHLDRNNPLQHVFRVYVFNAQLCCIDTLTSPSFTLNCSRKLRSKAQNVLPTPPTKKKKTTARAPETLDLLYETEIQPLLDIPDPLCDAMNSFADSLEN